MSVGLRLGLAKAIRELRVRRGLTQEALAHGCGIHRTYVSLLERGAKSPTVEVISRIARALNTTPSKLLAAAEKRSMPGERARS